MPRDKLLDEILEAQMCAGCGLCASIAPAKVEMSYDSDGFARPHATESLSPREQDEVKSACPGLKVEHDSITPNYHPSWGPLEAAYTAFATDPGVRHSGSSGGALSAVLIHLLESNEVDYIAHIGASAEEPLKNQLHLSRTRSDVVHNAGSRYSPSAPLATLHEVCEQPGRLAFVGKPCDVAALRRYIQQHPEVGNKIKYLISFMCAGVPSLAGTKAMLDRWRVDESQVRSIRYRGEGWPGKAKVELMSGEVHEMNYEESWGSILNRHLQLRCKICPDGTGEFADLVCADAWFGDEKGYPDFAERPGRSLVLTRNPHGESLMRQCMNSGIISARATPVSDIDRMQPHQLRRKQMVLSRLLALKLRGRRTPRFRNLKLLKSARQGGLLANLKSFVGMLRRTSKHALGQKSRWNQN